MELCPGVSGCRALGFPEVVCWPTCGWTLDSGGSTVCMDEAGPEASALEAFWWVGPDPNAKKLEGELKNVACQHQCPHDRMITPRWLLPVSVSPG